MMKRIFLIIALLLTCFQCGGSDSDAEESVSGFRGYENDIASKPVKFGDGQLFNCSCRKTNIEEKTSITLVGKFLQICAPIPADDAPEPPEDYPLHAASDNCYHACDIRCEELAAGMDEDVRAICDPVRNERQQDTLCDVDLDSEYW